MTLQTLRKILVVDDDEDLRKMLVIFLGVEDFEVICAATGKDALHMAATDRPDLVLLDLGLGDIDGKDVIKNLRQWANLPIIVLSARTDDEETALTLRLGADDYITKPFHADILLARIHANLRHTLPRPRAGGDKGDLVNGPIRIDRVQHAVFVHDLPVAVSPKEFDMLRLFVSQCGRSLTHKDILREVWGPSHTGATQYLRVYIGQLRAKLDASGGLGRCIASESGVGYRMDVIGEKFLALQRKG